MKKSRICIVLIILLLVVLSIMGIFLIKKELNQVFPIENDDLYTVIVSKEYPERPNIHTGLPEDKILYFADTMSNLDLKEDRSVSTYWLNSEARNDVLYEVVLMYHDSYKPTVYLYFCDDGGIVVDLVGRMNILDEKDYLYYIVDWKQYGEYKEVLSVLEELVPLCEVRD